MPPVKPLPGDRATPGVLDGPAKLGTTDFWTYPIRVVVVAPRRRTLALTAADDNRSETAVGRLWGYVTPLDRTVQCVLLGRGCYAGPMIHRLQDHVYPFVRPAVRRGSVGSGTTGPRVRPGSSP